MSPSDEGGFFDFADNWGGYPALESVYIIPPRVCPPSLASQYCNEFHFFMRYRPIIETMEFALLEKRELIVLDD